MQQLKRAQEFSRASVCATHLQQLGYDLSCKTMVPIQRVY